MLLYRLLVPGYAFVDDICAFVGCLCAFVGGYLSKNANSLTLASVKQLNYSILFALT